MTTVRDQVANAADALYESRDRQADRRPTSGLGRGNRHDGEL